MLYIFLAALAVYLIGALGAFIALLDVEDDVLDGTLSNRATISLWPLVGFFKLLHWILNGPEDAIDWPPRE